MGFMGWEVIFGNEEMAGYKSGGNGDLWFIKSKKNEVQDYDQVGVNHISLKVESIKEVDEVVSFLKENNISPLFDTPRHRPEFASEESQTYYQVMFETPDQILFEVVYIGAKN